MHPIIGVTGIMGSGKSTVCKLFEALGIAHYNADNRAKDLMTHDTQLKEAIIDLFGGKAYQKENLNRSWLSEQAFNNPQKLQSLNEIVHPRVRADFEDFVQRQKKGQQSGYSLYESALIFEQKQQHRFDKIILVTAPLSLCLKRITERDQMDTTTVKKRLKHQWSIDKKIAGSDFIINNEDLEQTKATVLKIDQMLRGNQNYD